MNSPARSDLSASQINSQSIYQTLIRQTPDLHSIVKFKNNKSNKKFYPDAQKFPDFFNYNLVSPGRIIKHLEGPESIFRGFYYQLMKLAFEIEIEQKDYIEIMKSVIFSPDLMIDEKASSPISGKTYSDLQYKKIIAEFMEILMNQSIPNFQLTILNYPIVDEALVKIFQNLLQVRNNRSYNKLDNTLAILEYFSQIFQITMVQYSNCYKFEQSDIFLYEQSPEQFYIAFLNQMGQMSDGQMSSASKKQDNQSSHSSNQMSSSKKLQNTLHRNLQIQNFTTEQQASNGSASKSRQINPYSSHQVTQNKDKIQHYRTSSNLIKSGSSSKNESQKITAPLKTQTFVFQSNRVQKDIKTTFMNSQNSYQYQRKAPQFQISNYGETQIKTKNITMKVSNNDLTKIESCFQYESNNNLIEQNSRKNNFLLDYHNTPAKGNVSTLGLNSDQKVIGYSGLKSQLSSNNKFASSNHFGSQIDKLKQSQFRKDLHLGHNSKQSKNNHFQVSNNNFSKSRDIKNRYQFTSSVGQSYNYSKSSAETWNYKPKENYLSQFQQIKVQSSNKNTLSEQQQFTIHRPTNIMNKKNQFLNLIQNQQHYKEKDPNDGTMYNQFTDTRVMDMLPYEIQENIRRIRRKFKGYHTKDFKGFY